MHKSKKKGSERHYGWQPSRPDHRDFQFVPHPALMDSQPLVADVTAPALPNPFATCLDQAHEGACGPHSVTECLLVDGERNESLSPMPMPSRQFIYWTTRYLMGTTGQDSGVDNRTMMKALAAYGWCDESLWPYLPSNLATEPNAVAIAQAATRKVVQYNAVAQSEATMRACIAGGRPFVFGFTVYESFEGGGPAENGVIPMPSRGEQAVGGHDVSFMGYNATKGPLPGVKPGNLWPAGTWKFRNHWYNAPGVPWGDGGYGYMPDAYALNPRLSSDFWCILQTGLPAKAKGKGYIGEATSRPQMVTRHVLTMDWERRILSLDKFDEAA